jgi:hypothetical protein
MLGSRRSDDVAPRLHRRGPEDSVRFCGGEMALDVERALSYVDAPVWQGVL